MDIIYIKMTADYNYSWDNTPRRQFIVNINADVEITVSDGETKVIRQGEVMFLEDTTGVCICVYVMYVWSPPSKSFQIHVLPPLHQFPK